MAGMMKKVQKMQADMKKMQDELKKKTVEVSVGGGVVKVVMNGEKQMQSLVIDKAAVDPEDVEMLQDLILSAVNQAMVKVDEMMASEMSKLPLMVPALLRVLELPFRVKFPAMVPKLFTLPFLELKERVPLLLPLF